ncbi:MAG: serine/threonine-protein kinase, partial [Planctomycetales bacterium]
DGDVRAYAKFFKESLVTDKRIRRAKWLIEQRIADWTEEMTGAPYRWLDTQSAGRPDGIGFHFACCLSKAVPGGTWLEVKGQAAAEEVRLDDAFRQRCVENLIRAAAHLEQRDFVHGDLSPNNIIVNTRAAIGEPALYVIDFDGFVAPAVGRDLYRLASSEGETFGTLGYCPPDLERQHSNGDARVAPYSDRYARDMLLLELLCYEGSRMEDQPVCEWLELTASFDLERVGFHDALAHLKRPDVFTMSENERPSTDSLARALAIPRPPRVKQAAGWAGAFPGFNAPSPATVVEQFLSATTILLWLSCAALLGLFCVLSAQWLVTSPDDAMRAAMRLPIQLLIGGGVFVAGLTVLAFATDRPRMVNVLGWWFRIPARPDNARSENLNRLRAMGALLGIMIGLGVAVVILRRLG